MGKRRISIIVDSRGVNKVARDLDKLNRTGNLVAGAFGRVTSGLSKFAHGIWRYRYRIFALGTALAYGVLKPFTNLEFTLARVRVAVGGTAEDLQLLESLATQLGRDTLYTASDAAEGMLYLAKAGFDVNQILAATPGVLNAAILEQMDLGQAADIVTGLLYEFGLAADQATRAADVLAKGSNLAKTDMLQMSEALKYFGPTAHQLGYSIEEAVGMLDVLAGSMIRGDMAGTALRRSMIEFQTIMVQGFSGKQSKAIQSLGLDAGVLEQAIRKNNLTLTDFLGTLVKAGATTGHLSELFEQRAATAAYALGSAVGDSYEEFVEALRGATDYAAESGQILEDTLWGQTQQIKSSIETMTNAIARTFAPGLRDFLEHDLRPFINQITETWETGGNTWQEKVKSVWNEILLPEFQKGLDVLEEKIKEKGPALAKAMGTMLREAAVPVAQGILAGIADLFVDASEEGWRPAIDRLFRKFGERVEFNPRQFSGTTPPITDPLEQARTFVALSTSSGTPDAIRQLFLEHFGVAGGQSVEHHTSALEENTAAIQLNTGAIDDLDDDLDDDLNDGASETLLSKVFAAGTGLFQDTLMGAVTDPITSELQRTLGPTSERIGRLTDCALRIFDAPLSMLNGALDLIVGLLGGPAYSEGRYAHAGAYQANVPGAWGAPGSVSASSAVSVGTVNINGVRGGDEAGAQFVDELAHHEAVTTHQMARSLRRGMVTREAMER